MRNPFACRRFRHLCLEARDRDLAPEERRFIRKHAEACTRCEKLHRATDAALSALRNLAQQAPESNGRFAGRVLRRFQVETVRQSFRYWSPALLAATVAAGLVLAAIQVATQHAPASNFHAGDSQARRITVEPVLPNLTPSGAAAPSR